MDSVSQNRKINLMKLTAIVLAVLMVTSSLTMIQSRTWSSPQETTNASNKVPPPQERSFRVNSLQTGDSTWVSFDSSLSGTPAEAHMTLVDQLGLTLVADFYGFWKSNKTVRLNETTV
ncbi:MAG: hypothetical protein ACXAEB_15545, partial [Candidatus Thorarchaeota archaeon]